MSDVHVLIGGEAGQGLVTVGSLMTKALVRSGYEVLVTQDYMSRVRGGHNTWSIRFGLEPLLGPGEEVDVLVALAQETVDLYTGKLSERAVIVADESIKTNHDRVFRVPFKELAPKPIFYNTVALGVLASVVCRKLSILEEMLGEVFAKKGKEIVNENIEVLRAAAAWKERHEKIFECPAPSLGHEGRLTMNGNQAIALGAMAAGVNFCSFYPMTPSTSIPLTLIANAAKLGIVIEQAEDELSAINMALGASTAGGRAIVATSGGGFALMTEGVSLAGCTETPIVIALIQRPGPATGLPTRTEQADLNLALYAGHGEFPRAILAPGDVEQCFHLTHRAFDLAEKYQIPAFVLSDQYLADSFRATAPFDLDALPPVASPVLKPDNPAAYRRYAHSESGVSPRAVPGLSEALVVVDSDEHDEFGHITEDHGVRNAMMEKRSRKLCGIFGEIVPPDLYGPKEPQTLLVCYGSTMGPAMEAAERMTGNGETTAVLHFSQVWPVNSDHFKETIAGAGRVIFVEGNSTGQFAMLLKAQANVEADGLVLRYDGLPFTASYIVDRLASAKEAVHGQC